MTRLKGFLAPWTSSGFGQGERSYGLSWCRSFEGSSRGSDLKELLPAARPQARARYLVLAPRPHGLDAINLHLNPFSGYSCVAFTA